MLLVIVCYLLMIHCQLANRYLKFYLPLFEVLLQIFLYHHIHLAQ